MAETSREESIRAAAKVLAKAAVRIAREDSEQNGKDD